MGWWRKVRKPLLRVITTCIVILVLFFLGMMIISNRNEQNYKQAIDLLNDGQYDQAIAIFSSLNDYSDSNQLAMESEYLKAQHLELNGDRDGAIALYLSIGDYKESKDKYQQLSADKLFDSGMYSQAWDI